MAHSYSRQEVHDVAAKLLASQKKVKNLKRIILAGAVAIVLGSALVLGLVFAANEASKEVKTSDRQLKDTNGNDIITATAKYAITVGDFNPVEDIQFMDDMVATDANGVEYSLRIDGWAIDWDNTGVMTVFLAHGFKVTIHPGALNADGTTATPASMALVMPDGATNTYFQFDDVLEDLVPAPEQDGGARLLSEVDCSQTCGNGFSGAQRDPWGGRQATGRGGFGVGSRNVCRCSNSRVGNQQFGNSQRQGGFSRGRGRRGPGRGPQNENGRPSGGQQGNQRGGGGSGPPPMGDQNQQGQFPGQGQQGQQGGFGGQGQQGGFGGQGQQGGFPGQGQQGGFPGQGQQGPFGGQGQGPFGNSPFQGRFGRF